MRSPFKFSSFIHFHVQIRWIGDQFNNISVQCSTGAFIIFVYIYVRGITQ